MKRHHFIGLDTHCQTTDLAAVSASGRLLRRQRCATNITALRELLLAIPAPRSVAIEEGPMADWLWRNLADCAEEFIVSEPRRNHLIANESDKDDPIDAEKLAQLLRGGYLKAVHHPQSQERAIFKHHVALYHDGVRQRVRQANQIIGALRRYGIVVRESAFDQAEHRKELLDRLPACRLLHDDLRLLWRSYDRASRDEEQMRRRLVQGAKEEEVIRRWVELPGIGWVRAATLLVYLDTPWRFASKAKLWKYLGIGLERRQSGSGPVRLRVVGRCNRELKTTILGAARTAVRTKDNPFAAQYQRWKEDGASDRQAVRNVARSLATTLWGMWKSGGVYHPEWVGVPAAAVRATAVSE